MTTDSLFIALAIATIVIYCVKANGLGFFSDDWRLAQRGGSVGDYFEPYADSLITVPIAIYRALYDVFGFRTAVPLRVVGVVSGAAVAGAMYFVVRTRVGSVPALVVGTTLLWYPNFVTIPSTFDHYLALTAIILCAWLVTKDGINAAVALGLTLAFALCTAGVAVAGGAGLVTYLLLARAPRSRWIAVVAPLVGWAIWWLLVSNATGGRGGHSVSQVIGYASDGIAASFRGLVLDSSLLAVFLGVAFVLTLLWRIRAGIGPCRNQVAWTVALVAWWCGVGYSRGAAFGAHTLRYDLIGSAFVALALLPTRPTAQRLLDGGLGLVAGVTLAVVIVTVNHGAIFDNQERLDHSYAQIRINTIVGNLDPAVVPDRVRLPLGPFVIVSAGTYRGLVARLGAPSGSQAKDVDASIVALGHVRPVVVQRPEGRCTTFSRPVKGASGSTITIEAGHQDVPVRVRRFEQGWTDVGTISAGATAIVPLPGPADARPWTVDAPGACRAASVHVAMSQPRPHARLSGATVLAAKASGTVSVSAVDFELRRDGDAIVTTLRAKKNLYGWVHSLDAAQLPNGSYTITAVATDETGTETVSAGVPVVIER